MHAHAHAQVVLGNECMYEPTHAKLVAAVLAQRLAPGGCALLCSAVRSLVSGGSCSGLIWLKSSVNSGLYVLGTVLPDRVLQECFVCLN